MMRYLTKFLIKLYDSFKVQYCIKINQHSASAQSTVEQIETLFILLQSKRNFVEIYYN